MNDAPCMCGHSKSDHVYEEGACRPGFRCEEECTEYRPQQSFTDQDIRALQKKAAIGKRRGLKKEASTESYEGVSRERLIVMIKAERARGDSLQAYADRLAAILTNLDI